MKRIIEIITEARERFFNDDFFPKLESLCRDHPGKKSYRAYNDALMVLDNDSWQILKAKALDHYPNEREGQKKQGFFNQLNEAFAYRYLLGKGCKDVRIIKETKKKQIPDIKFTFGNIQNCCEVKTIGISNDEIERRNLNQRHDSRNLDDKFMGKFRTTVDVARQQIIAFGSKGLVYIIINFDDWTLEHYQNYRKQLILFSKAQNFDDVFIKIGLRGNKNICLTRYFK